MRYEDTEIQIRIAELQADIQINSTISAGFFAAAIAVLAISIAFYPTFRMQIDLQNLLVAFLVTVVEIICVYGANEFRKRTKLSRNELKKLREKYSW